MVNVKKRIRLLFFIIIFMPFSSFAEEITPFDSYKAISKIIYDLEEIYKSKRLNIIIDNIPLDKNKTPTDVYDQSYILLQKAIMLSHKDGFKTDYDIKLPPKKIGRKIPVDVVEVLLEVLKITDSIRYNMGISKEYYVDIEPGVTPPYTYQKVSKAIILVDKLL